ncbi:MAG TPA: zf-HC2 domain-containing protein, partial [Longimicrobiaceae bacterium]|nr:zf-HC2 domain-containing protein [Longimicrobiaceae bacterium]
MTPSTREEHVSRDDLLRWLDGECAPGERARIGGHLERCAACMTTLETLRTRSERLDGLLRELDVERPGDHLPRRPPARRAPRWSAPVRRAAVVAGLLVGAA